MLCPLDFCDEVLVHLLQTCLRQKNSSCRDYLLLRFVSKFRVTSFLRGRAWHGFEGKFTRISNVNLDSSAILPGAVRCMPKDVRLHSKGDCLRNQYQLSNLPRGSVPAVLGWPILLLVFIHS